MARHTVDRVMELISEGYNDPEQIAKILEMPTHKVRKVLFMIKGTDLKEKRDYKSSTYQRGKQ